MYGPTSRSAKLHMRNFRTSLHTGIVAVCRSARQGRLLALACCALVSMLAACGTGTPGTGRATATVTKPATPTPTSTSVSQSVYFLANGATGSTNTVYALNPADGTVRWSHQLPTSSGQILAAASGTLYVVGQQGAIIALRAQDGSQIWSITGHSGLYIQPAADRGMIFVSSQGDSASHGYLDAYRASDGTQVWEHDEGLNTGALLAASGDVLYTSDGKTLSALRESDGGTLWQQSVVAPVQPIAIGASVYLNNSGEVFAFDASSGAPQWHYKPAMLASPSDETVSACAGLIFAGNSTKLNALQAANGSLAWSNTYQHIVGGTSCNNGVVYFSPATGQLLALNATTGAQTWSAPLLGNSGWAPVLSGSTLYESRSDAETAQPNGYVYALNPATGAVVWKYAQSGAGFTQIVVM